MSPKKVLVLGILILVPVFAFLFLQIFGTNEYQLRRYYPVLDERTEEPVMQNGDTLFQPIPSFRLTNQSGQVFSEDNLKGRIYVANFIFTSCRGVCKKMSSQMTRVQEAFRQEPEVQLVSFTVDPERDSAAVLQQYASQYGAIAGKWHFLTGPKPVIYQLAIDGFKLPLQEAPTVLPDFIHSEKFILVDQNRYVRGIYDGTNEEDVDRLITELKILLQEKPTHENK